MQPTMNSRTANGVVKAAVFLDGLPEALTLAPWTVTLVSSLPHHQSMDT
jgi:hypothetical protein